MKAEELFKNVGYEKTYDKDGVIEYSRDERRKLTFNRVVWYRAPQKLSYFKPNEIKAIYEQLKELGQLEENKND